MEKSIREKAGELWETSKESSNDYWLTRFLFLRLLGVTYFFGFLSLLNQVIPLLGSNGLTPVKSFLPEYAGYEMFLRLPTIFWFNQSDMFLLAMAALGLLISTLIVRGFGNVPLLSLNWFIYMSFVHVGQVWYGYGWETQLLETGFLAIFLVPLIDPRPFSRKVPPPKPLIWLLRWLTFRIHIGSGLIKLKGVQCWEYLSCLERFFQTQPIPNPVSPWMHYLPSFIKKIGVLYTHIVQIIAPWTGVFENRLRDFRIAGGVLMLSLQLFLILVGNFALLNWITITAIVSFFDDRFLSRFFPKILVKKAEKAKEEAREISDLRHLANIGLILLVVALSVPVVVNLVSSSQAMNASFNNLHIVNTYGAFGSVRDSRTELVIEGTHNLSNPEWKEYDFPAKPDQEDDPLPVVAPYQPRIAWQMWFASMSSPENEPWLLHLTWKLLYNDPEALELVKHNPFPEKPPNHIRIQIYRFEMEPPLKEDNWDRQLLGTWMPPTSKNNTRLENYLERRYHR